MRDLIKKILHAILVILQVMLPAYEASIRTMMLQEKVSNKIKKKKRDAFWDQVIAVIIQILKIFVPLLSNQLRKWICGIIIKMKEEADQTQNEWDDMVVDFLITIFDIEIEKIH